VEWDRVLNVIRIRRYQAEEAVKIQLVLNDVYEIMVLVVKEFQVNESLGHRN
jgi:hypothetical protein